MAGRDYTPDRDDDTSDLDDDKPRYEDSLPPCYTSMSSTLKEPEPGITEEIFGKRGSGLVSGLLDFIFGFRR